MPIIVLSARDDATDKVDALDAGADDYVTKPFGWPSSLARIRAAVRRARRVRHDRTREPVVRTCGIDSRPRAKKVTTVEPRSG